MFRCTVCNKTEKYRANIRRHLETHLYGLSYECQICGKNFKSSESRRVHKIKSHKGLPRYNFFGSLHLFKTRLGILYENLPVNTFFSKRSCSAIICTVVSIRPGSNVRFFEFVTPCIIIPRWRITKI